MSPCQPCSIIAFFFVLQSVTQAHKTPVLIYGIALNHSRSVFPAMTKLEFQEIARNLSSAHTLVVFEEEELGSNILSGDKSFGEFPVAELYTFYACVEDPIRALKNVMAEVQYISTDKKGKLVSFVCESLGTRSLFMIQRYDFDEEGSHLRRRVNTIKDLSEKWIHCVNPPLFFFLNEENDDDDEEWVDKNCTDYEILTPEITTTEPPIELFSINVKAVATTIANKLTIIDIATNGNRYFIKSEGETKRLTVKARFYNGYRDVYEVVYDGISYHGHKIKWREGSEFASKGLTFRAGRNLLRINSFQMNIRPSLLPPRPPEVEEYENVYVTPGILSGLLVVGLLGSIAFWGITMILDIGSNDRFDDLSTEIIYNRSQ